VSRSAQYQDKNNNSADSSKKVSAVLSIAILLAVVIIAVLAYDLFEKISGSNENDIQAGSAARDSVIQIEVLNGCGTAGLGDIVTEFLRSDSIDVINTGNYISFDFDFTVIIDRSGKIENALVIAEALGLGKDAVIQQINNDYFLDVSVILGRDYQSLIPVKERYY
jgi:hypothetical protein